MAEPMTRGRDEPLKGVLTDPSDPLCNYGFRQDTATPVSCSLRSLRHVLVDKPPRGDGHYGWRLRGVIGDLWNDLCDQDHHEGYPTRPDGPTGTERAQLIASLQDAARHLYAWCECNGCTGTFDIPDEDAARQGWPDETGKGWTPPWDILGMAPPDYWGSPDQSA